MKLVSLSRSLSAGAMFVLVSMPCVSAGTIRHVTRGIESYRPVAGLQSVVRPKVSCPPSYTVCASPTRSTPYTATWCISSTGTCSNGLVGEWNWTAVVGKAGHGNAYKHVHASWSPDPGNPSTITITDNRRKAKGKKIIATVSLSTCEVTNGTCFSNFAVVGITN